MWFRCIILQKLHELIDAKDDIIETSKGKFDAFSCDSMISLRRMREMIHRMYVDTFRTMIENNMISEKYWLMLDETDVWAHKYEKPKQNKKSNDNISIKKEKKEESLLLQGTNTTLNANTNSNSNVTTATETDNQQKLQSITAFRSQNDIAIRASFNLQESLIMETESANVNNTNSNTNNNTNANLNEKPGKQEKDDMDDKMAIDQNSNNTNNDKKEDINNNNNNNNRTNKDEMDTDDSNGNDEKTTDAECEHENPFRAITQAFLYCLASKDFNDRKYFYHLLITRVLHSKTVYQRLKLAFGCAEWNLIASQNWLAVVIDLIFEITCHEKLEFENSNLMVTDG